MTPRRSRRTSRSVRCGRPIGDAVGLDLVCAAPRIPSGRPPSPGGAPGVGPHIVRDVRCPLFLAEPGGRLTLTGSSWCVSPALRGVPARWSPLLLLFSFARHSCSLVFPYLPWCAATAAVWSGRWQRRGQLCGCSCVSHRGRGVFAPVSPLAGLGPVAGSQAAVGFLLTALDRT